MKIVAVLVLVAVLLVACQPAAPCEGPDCPELVPAWKVLGIAFYGVCGVAMGLVFISEFDIDPIYLLPLYLILAVAVGALWPVYMGLRWYQDNWYPKR